VSGRPWTPAEEAVLEERFGVDVTSVLAERLGRTSSAVHQRALRLGLVAEDDLSLTQVREILGLGSDYRLIYAWLRDGLLIRRRKYGGRRSLIREVDLIAFLRANDHLIDRDRVDAAYRQFVAERWITTVEAFRRGASHPVELEHAFHAGLVDEVRKRGVRWVIPESILPRLVAGRRRFTEDAEHRRQVRMYDRLQARGTLRAMQRARPRLRRSA
jgi:hypothetical protein